MAVYQDREAFIPYRRTDIINLCLEDAKLSVEQEQKFREFCQILSAYYHFKFHHYLEILKDNFAPFQPHSKDNQFRFEPTLEEKEKMEAGLIDAFEKLLEKANFYPLSEESLKQAFQAKSLIQLNTDVDFNDFERMVCYCRGDGTKKALVKQLFKEVEKSIDVFEEVALLIKCKEKDYFDKQNIPIDTLPFTPGKVYIYLYENVAKDDLEFVFPNVKISMTWKDRLLFFIPAATAVISVIVKILPQLLFILGVIIFVTVGQSSIEALRIEEDSLENIMPVLVTVLSLVLALGGVAFKQYNTYKTKYIKFQKEVTDTLFFRNLTNNVGVFQYLIDAAEEEECKEIILVYYHLLTSKVPLTAEQLDNCIEKWMEDKFDTKIDFDIQSTLENLSGIKGRIVKYGSDEVPLLSRDRDNFCHVLSLDEAKIVIDYIWDNAFKYA